MVIFIEIIFLLIVFSLQVNEFSKTLQSIKLYKDFIPDGTKFSLKSISLLENDLKNTDTDVILKDYESYNQRASIGKKELDEEFRILAYDNYMNLPAEIRTHDVADNYAKEIMSEKYGKDWGKIGGLGKVIKTNIIVSDKNSYLSQHIIFQINRYLIRNKGAVADFNLLRDIVERNLDTVENEISISIPVPIYLGLIGTMAGIVFGLFAIPGDFFSSSLQDEFDIAGSSMANIAPLINGVKYAMSVSCIGLALTLYNSGFKFKNARIVVDRSKNMFFNFLQTELIPVLSESVNTGIVNLNRRLENFGQSFEHQISSLEGIAETTAATMASQLNILKKVQEIDPIKIAQFNINAYKDLLKSIDSIQYFTEELNRLNHLFGNINNLVQRTENIDQVAQSIKLSLDQAADLQKFFHSHFSSIEDASRKFTSFLAGQNKVFSDSIEDVRNNSSDQIEVLKIQMTKDFEILKSYLEDKITVIKDLKISEDELLFKAFEENKDSLNNLKLLPELKRNTDGLSKLADISNSIKILIQKVDSSKSTVIRIEKENDKNSQSPEIIVDNEEDKGEEVSGIKKSWFRSFLELYKN